MGYPMRTIASLRVNVSERAVSRLAKMHGWLRPNAAQRGRPHQFCPASTPSACFLKMPSPDAPGSAVECTPIDENSDYGEEFLDNKILRDIIRQGRVRVASLTCFAAKQAQLVELVLSTPDEKYAHLPEVNCQVVNSLKLNKKYSLHKWTRDLITFLVASHRFDLAVQKVLQAEHRRDR